MIKIEYVPADEGVMLSFDVDTEEWAIRCQPDTPISKIQKAMNSIPRPPKKQGAMSKDSFLVGKHDIPEGDVIARIARVLEYESATTPTWCAISGYLLGVMDGKRQERARHKHE